MDGGYTGREKLKESLMVEDGKIEKQIKTEGENGTQS